MRGEGRGNWGGMGSGVSNLAVLYNYVVECLFISWILSLLFGDISRNLVSECIAAMKHSNVTVT